MKSKLAFRLRADMIGSYWIKDIACADPKGLNALKGSIEAFGKENVMVDLSARLEVLGYSVGDKMQKQFLIMDDSIFKTFKQLAA